MGFLICWTLLTVIIVALIGPFGLIVIPLAVASLLWLD